MKSEEQCDKPCSRCSRQAKAEAGAMSLQNGYGYMVFYLKIQTCGGEIGCLRPSPHCPPTLRTSARGLGGGGGREFV